jgi:hypothetical protein
MPKRSDSAKTLYEQYYAQKYQDFIRSDKESFSLPARHWSPYYAAMAEDDHFKWKKVEGAKDNKVKTILKKSVLNTWKHHGLVWTTHPEKIREGVRWGIVRAESITGQVIGTLGRYRITAHERIAKGMVSNTQALKIAALDIYQERFEALQILESLVNTKSDVSRYEEAIDAYIIALRKIQTKTETIFPASHLKKIDYENLPARINADIEEDIKEALKYREKLPSKLRAANRARGNDSILEFVKKQMHKGLYELQGVNQDIVFSKGTLTRGELNDYIEDARKVIDDHRPDMRNAVTAKHHGDFSDADKEVTYSLDGLSQEEERQALLAISFIEGWDRVDYRNEAGPRVFNRDGDSIALKTISATKWRIYRNFSGFFRFVWEYGKNWLMGLVIATRPWEEEISDNGKFKLYVSTLKEFSRLNDPLWKKFWDVIYDIGLSIKNISDGVSNFGKELFTELPEDILCDWYSSEKPPAFDDLLTRAGEDIEKIILEETKRLNKVISESRQLEIDQQLKGAVSVLAQPDYPLESLESDDPLTAATEGARVFASHFTHPFNKDPVACLLFTGVSLSTGLYILQGSLPAIAGVFGANPITQMVCGSSALGQGAQVAFNTLIEGPSCHLATFAKKFVDNPMPGLVALGGAYGLGYGVVSLLETSPVIGEYIRGEMGSIAQINEILLGAKLGIGAYFIFYSGESETYHPVEIQYQGEEIGLSEEHKKLNQRLRMVQWLNKYSKHLHKLDIKKKFQISQQLDEIFDDAKQADSLKKLLYPEQKQSIAYYFFAIPFGYLFSFLRLGFSFFMFPAALICKRSQPFQPMRRVGLSLFKEIKKDLSRLVTASGNVLFTIVNVAASPFRALIFVAELFIGRVAILGWHPGHAMHKAMSAIHSLYRSIGEFLYPARVMKGVVYAHPVHTVNEVLGTRARFIKEHGGAEKKSSGKKAAGEQIRGLSKEAARDIIRWNKSKDVLFKAEERTVEKKQVGSKMRRRSVG